MEHTPPKISKGIYLILILVFSIYLGVFSLQKINLTGSDTGRHIKNGDVILHAKDYGVTFTDILTTNFFSYTHQSFPFVNHHWGSGVLFYITYITTGWNGLSLGYYLILLLTLLCALAGVIRKAPLSVSIPITFFLIPLLAERTEIRPEVLSYLFIMFFIYILSAYKENTISKKYIWLLPFTMLFWVNMHIYFIFGFFVLGAFGIEAVIRKNWSDVKKIFLITGASLLTACINPFGITILYYPFTIFKNYGYLVAENQSISFLEQLHIPNPNFLWWKILTSLLVITIVSVIIYYKRKRLSFTETFPFALVCITGVFAYLSFNATRNLALFGFVSLPLLIELFGTLMQDIEKNIEVWIIWTWSVVISIVIIICSLIHFSHRLPGSYTWGIGLLPNNMGSAHFVLETGLHGPFFNNYDIGSYFIFNMFTKDKKEKVFVDNRPEGYPDTFFTHTYIPMQENDAVWKKAEDQYKFNAIWFYRLDMTPWSQQFLISKIDDSEWVPVFVDDYTVIFVRNNQENAEIIRAHALPRSMFGSRSQN